MNDDSKQKHYSWKEGMPTKPDVDLLLKKWPDPQVGNEFNYSEIEDLIGVNRALNHGRFVSVTNAWRKRLLETGVVIECSRNESFYVASADQVSSATYGTLLSIGRKAKRHRKKLSVIKTETDDQRNTINHQGRLLHEVERQAKKSRMNILPKTGVNTALTIVPPEIENKLNGEKQ